MKKLLSFALIASFVSISAHASDVSGTSSATFTNPQLSTTTYSGVGSNSFTWGDPAGFGVGPNNLTFIGSLFNSPFNTPFKLGTLTYFNGTTAIGTTATTVDFNTLLGFTAPSIPDVSSTFTLALNSTPNTSDPVASADYVTFNSLTSSSNFAIAGINYTVKINGFSNVIGDGFLASSTSEFHVTEGGTASADLYGSVVVAVPEPETFSLMLIGVGLTGAIARRRKSKQA